MGINRRLDDVPAYMHDCGVECTLGDEDAQGE